MTYTYLDCDCKHPRHVLRFIWDNQDLMLYTEISLNHYLSFWQRLRAALRYVVGLDSNCAYDGWLISGQEDIEKFKAYVAGLAPTEADTQ